MSETQSGWQPIETAPRDGTWILLWDDLSGIAVGGYWDADADDWSLDVDLLYVALTQWLPHPLASAAVEEADDD